LGRTNVFCFPERSGDTSEKKNRKTTKRLVRRSILRDEENRNRTRQGRIRNGTPIRGVRLSLFGILRRLSRKTLRIEEEAPLRTLGNRRLRRGPRRRGNRTFFGRRDFPSASARNWPCSRGHGGRALRKFRNREVRTAAKRLKHRTSAPALLVPRLFRPENTSAHIGQKSLDRVGILVPVESVFPEHLSERLQRVFHNRNRLF